jgi:trehalose-6-phosphatase
MDLLEVDPRQTPPLYIGDDRTDEDAFRALAGDGMGILVSERPQASAAAYRLDDPAAVGRFLARLLDMLGEEAAREQPSDAAQDAQRGD